MQKVSMNIKEAAELLGVSVSTMYTAVRENNVPHVKIRGRIIFHRETLEKFLRGEYQQAAQA